MRFVGGITTVGVGSFLCLPKRISVLSHSHIAFESELPKIRA
jgi:hypothetical protein